jgi:hypothetical protein
VQALAVGRIFEGQDVRFVALFDYPLLLVFVVTGTFHDDAGGTAALFVGQEVDFGYVD